MDYIFIAVYGGRRDGEGEMVPKMVEVVGEAATSFGIGRDESSTQSTEHLPLGVGATSPPLPRRFLQFPSLSSYTTVALVTTWACDAKGPKKKRVERKSLADWLRVPGLHCIRSDVTYGMDTLLGHRREVPLWLASF